MKFIKYIFLVVIAVSSCNKLDLTPKDKISETDTWRDPALIQLYVNACYNSMLHGFQQDLFPSACDDAFNIHGPGNLAIVQKGELTADNVTSISTKINYFDFAYDYIRTINIFFSKIEAAPGDEAFKDATTGEMKFIRAYLYANLIWRYSGVPIITKVFGLHDDFTVERASYDDCVKFIVTELDEAVKLLPADQPDDQKGRASANACLALKSRVLLYAASALNNPNHDKAKWQAAADAANALLNVGYQLNPDYQQTFLEDNNEIIFARHFTQANSTEFNLWQGRNGSNGWMSQNPTQNIVNSYEMKATGKRPYTVNPDGSLVLNQNSGYDPSHPYVGRDPRFDASIIHDGTVWAGRTTETYHGGMDSPESSTGYNASLTSYAYKKFLIENIPPVGSTLRPTNPWIFFRYAEILLNYAEAEFELGNEVIAREYLNKVRSRPGVKMPPVTENGAALRDRIQNERRVELAFEGHRFFDVRRWKIASEVLNQPLLRMDIVKATNGTKTYTIKKLYDSKFLDKHYLIPIPRAEVDKSQGSLEQNKGY